MESSFYRQLLAAILEGIGAYLRFSKSTSPRIRSFRFAMLVLPLARPLMQRYAQRGAGADGSFSCLPFLVVPVIAAMAYVLTRYFDREDGKT